MIEKIIYFVFVLVVINTSVTAKNIDSGKPPNFINDEVELSADTIYSCTMHPDIKSLQPGKCPLCKMTLKEVSVEKAKENLLKNDFKVK
jgi:hypothetical protein